MIIFRDIANTEIFVNPRYLAAIIIPSALDPNSKGVATILFGGMTSMVTLQEATRVKEELEMFMAVNKTMVN